MDPLPAPARAHLYADGLPWLEAPTPQLLPLTGRLMSLRPDLWRVDVDRRGPTHITPIADAARRDSRSTERIARQRDRHRRLVR